MLVSIDTFHVEDYSKIVADALDSLIERKRKHREEIFPDDCRKAFEMGARFASEPAAVRTENDPELRLF
jgi:hypothetical protein